MNRTEPNRQNEIDRVRDACVRLRACAWNKKEQEEETRESKTQVRTKHRNKNKHDETRSEEL